MKILACVLVAAGCLCAQSVRCPIFAKLPADLKDSDAAENRLWFELRQCNGETVVVNAYVSGRSVPALTVKTGQAYPVMLSHTINVQVKRLQKEVVVSVPPKAYPGPGGKFSDVPDVIYRFALEN